MTATSNEFTQRRLLWYRRSGWAFLAIGLVAAALNSFLPVPDYQKLSWLLVAFFLVSGMGALAVVHRVVPRQGKVVEYGEALVVAIFLAVLIRGGLVQAFKIPSGSMLPTLQIGDHLLVSKFLYGIRIPYTGVRLFQLRHPQRGDVVVFAYPVDDSKDFIKRVIGEPGDTVEVRSKKVYINGERIEDPWGVHRDPTVLPQGFEKRDNFGPVKVPEGHYFMMGDNRDRSYDSRFWGFVAEPRIRGEAFILYWSWNGDTNFPRFGRMGKIIR